MSPTRIAIILAALLFGGLFLFSHKGTSTGTVATSSPTTTLPSTDTVAPSTATNYDECLAEGNAPLPDAPDKCLTRDGHIFIKGVVE